MPASTLADVSSDAKDRFAAWTRRGLLAMLLVFVLVGLSTWLGVHSDTATAKGGGYELALRYAKVARPGLDIPWDLSIIHPGGFDGQVTVEVSSDYFALTEMQGLSPAPAKETQDGQWWRMTFDPPPDGDTLVVSIDFYVQPSSQRGASAAVRVLDHEQPAATVHYRTTLLP